jgi:hypothetical protein
MAASQAARGLTAIPYFPSDEVAQTMIAEELVAMCESVEQAQWLVRRVIRIYKRWPGVQELRLVFCSKYRPLDGQPAIGISDVYPDGIPSEKPASPQLALPASRSTEISASPSIERSVAALAQAKDLNGIRKRVAVPEVPLVRIPEGKRITQKDISDAVEENMRKAEQ